MTTHVEVFVVGAGPAGLTAAYCLSKQEPSVLVIEKDPAYVGGISRTVNYNGFSFDIGGHRFFSKSKEVVDLWREILPDDFIERPRLSRIYYNGKYYSYPLKAFEALTNLGVFTSALCMLSYGWAKTRPIKEARTFHDWVRNQFGEKLFQIFFKTYTEKVWGMSCDEISADWAAQRIKGLDLWVAIINALKRSMKPAGGAKAADGTVVTVQNRPTASHRALWRLSSMRMAPPCARILSRAASHIMPGPRRGYSKLSISVFTTGSPAFGLRAGSSAFLSAFITATPRSSPLMRCAAQSAEISSHDMPHTFSV